MMSHNVGNQTRNYYEYFKELKDHKTFTKYRYFLLNGLKL